MSSAEDMAITAIPVWPMQSGSTFHEVLFMVNIRSFDSPHIVSTKAEEALKSNVTQNASALAALAKIAPSSGTTIQVSSLAQQLSEAAVRAAERDANSTRSELAAIATATIDKILGASYNQNKQAHDAEVPDTDDPALLERARQATDYANGKGSNPFKGMSAEQLSLIAYDESGAFTVNERRAAWKEWSQQDLEWRHAVVAKIMDEYSRTGEIKESLIEVAVYYKNLPAIELAQAPEGYNLAINKNLAQVASVFAAPGTVAPSQGTTTPTSSLAQQLSEAAVRAAERDANSTRSELAAIGTATIDKILGASYNQNKQAHDAEVPDTDDPALLERARQATDYANGKDSNPFKGMSPDQLSLIAYDESGTFTVNERRAAWIESSQQDQEWRRVVVAKMMDEYSRTGVIKESLIEVAAYYKNLPAIELARMPEGFDLSTVINPGEGPEKSTDRLMILVELMMNNWQVPEEAEPPEKKGSVTSELLNADGE